MSKFPVCFPLGGIFLGLILAFGPSASADDGPAHQTTIRPTPMGVSGGNATDVDTFCCSGTLGALVEDGSGTQYILSNDHVLAKSTQGSVGDAITQAGLIDTGCIANPDTVAHLTDGYLSFTSSTDNVDAAIAEVVVGKVNQTGTILDIGTISSATMTPVEALGKSVKKSGRTTGLTHGQVASIDVATSVKYLTKCAPGGKSNTASFQGQIRITPGEFSDSGDSGSLIVEDVATNPRAVALLFAGSSSSTVANPIDVVLSRLSIPGVRELSMVGGAPTPTGTISGQVTSMATGLGIQGASVSTVWPDQSSQQATADEGGFYTILDVPVGSPDVVATAAGFVESAPQSVAVVDGLDASSVDFALDPLPTGSITGTVTSSADSSPIQGATVETDTGESVLTDGGGVYTLIGVPTGSRTVTASAVGFESGGIQDVAVLDGQTTTGADVSLAPVTSASSAVVHCITYRTVAGPNRDKHLEIEIAIEDNLGNAVSGASVTADVTHPNGTTTFNGATDGSGVVVFKFISAAAGDYSTDVTAVSASGLSFDGTEPDYTFTKTSGEQIESTCASPASSSRKVNPVDVSSVIQVKRRHEANILSRKNVAGMGVGLSDGKPVIEIYLLETPGATGGQDFPTQLEGVPVRLVVTGEFVSRMICSE